ncbi:phytochrome-2 [Corynespora cassiicola Philippines]|uniref:Phytochrome-2 n=1 Tax=Corynespora cassiicola Philippines TaxID=1448308 RepID=A0A2T2NXM2_CORCC|nr:phytochrome-2 [Corynespora cassiicola Philippines]
MERVFPIRCNILDDSPHLTGAHQQQEIDQQRVVLVDSPRTEKSDPTPKVPETSPVVELPSFDAHVWSSGAAVEDAFDDASLDDPTELSYTERCEYAITDEGHGVVTGKRARFTRCEDEQIHIPGSIQSHGMLVALEIIDEIKPRYLVKIVSENSESIFRYPPRSLFALDDFLSIFPMHHRVSFNTHTRNVRNQFADTQSSAEPKVFSMTLVDPRGTLMPLWCAMHFVGPPHNLLVCEFEPRVGLDVATSTIDLPAFPYNSLDSDPRQAQSSFISRSKPLNVDVGKMFLNEGSTMEVLNVMSMIQQQLSSQENIQDLLDVIVGLVKELTGQHRVMAYAFDEQFNGKVVSELLDSRASSDIFKGLHFPATDIPTQARELYKINRVRVLFDRDQAPSRLIYRTATELDTPLDLTHAYLRAMSPVHLHYLKNMGVRSTMSVSLDFKNELWGLLVGHSYGPQRVPFPNRELVYWLGISASSCLDKLLNAERIQARSALAAMQLDFGPRVWIAASTDELLRLFRADFGFLVVQGEARTIGRLSSYLEAMTLLRYVYFRNFGKTFASNNITKDFPDLVYKPGFDSIAGILIIPLSQTAGDFIVFFRAGRDKTVHWAGNPNMSKKTKGGRLEPRNSFRKYTETVRRTCEPWREEQFEAAGMLFLVYGNFIRVWRQKEQALAETRMKRLLLVNLSHEVRTPLNAVVNWLEMALDKELDKSVKKILSMSHRASKSLIYVIDDLLHLTGGTRHPVPLASSAFHLPRGIQKTLDQLQTHAMRKNLTFDVIKDLDLPQFVVGDLQRLQQSVSSLVTNAITHTDEGGIVVHLALVTTVGESSVIQISVQDSGHGMTEQELDELFQEFEQLSDDDETPEKSPAEEKPTVRPRLAPKLGLGLALLARYIKHSGGQVRGKSVPGKGSTFAIEIPMQRANEAADSVRTRETFSSRRSRNVSDISPETPHRPSLRAIKFPTSPALFQIPMLQVDPPKAELLEKAPEVTQGVIASPGTSDLTKTLSETPLEENLTVLVADDNSINLAILCRRLNKMGHKCKMSRDGQQCFETWQQHRGEIDFVLMDLNMPLISGVQATEMIRAVEYSPHFPVRVPIFAVSASLDKHPQRTLIASGFDGWLTKPIDFARLDVILRGAIDKSTREKAMCRTNDFRNGGWFR